MKKLIISLLLLTLIVSQLACGNKEVIDKDVETPVVAEDTVEPVVETSEPVATQEPAETSESVTPAIQVEKTSDEVHLTFPKEFSEDMEVSPESLMGEEGIKDVIEHDDGSLTIIMNKEEHTAMIADLKTSLDQAMNDMKNDPNLDHVKDITADKDYRNIVITVDSSDYNPDMDFTPVSLAMMASLYQAFDGLTIDAHIEVVDAANGEVLNELSIPIEK